MPCALAMPSGFLVEMFAANESEARRYGSPSRGWSRTQPASQLPFPFPQLGTRCDQVPKTFSLSNMEVPPQAPARPTGGRRSARARDAVTLRHDKRVPTIT